MRKISDVKVGEAVTHPTKGDGVVIGVTKRTITIKWEFSTVKNTYRSNDSYFSVSDF